MFNLVDLGFKMQICSILCFSWSILVKFCVYLRTSSSRTQMLLLEKNIINRQSIHPIDTYVHKEAYDFTLEDLEDIIFFLGLNYISTKHFPAFFYNKARRSVISKYGPRYSSIDCDQVLFPFVSSLTHSHLTRDQPFFRGKGEKRTPSFSPRLQKKRAEGPPDRRLILTSTTPHFAALALNDAP